MATIAEQLGKFEPALKHRFRMYVDEVGGTPLAGREQFEIAVQSTGLPSKSMEEVELGVGTERIYYAWRIQYEPLTATIRDFINSASYAFMENWAQKIHEVSSGRRGYKSEYSGTARLQQLGVDDEVIKEWKLTGIWPQAFNAGDVDQTSSNEQVTFEITFRYDRATPTIF